MKENEDPLVKSMSYKVKILVSDQERKTIPVFLGLQCEVVVSASPVSFSFVLPLREFAKQILHTLDLLQRLLKVLAP